MRCASGAAALAAETTAVRSGLSLLISSATAITWRSRFCAPAGSTCLARRWKTMLREPLYAGSPGRRPVKPCFWRQLSFAAPREWWQAKQESSEYSGQTSFLS